VVGRAALLSGPAPGRPWIEILINGKRIAVVLPAYNAEKTLEATVRELPEIVDERILVDDHSSDATAEMARRLGLTVEVHPRNRGYGGNQKTCYAVALARNADVIVMLHPDYQYNPLLVTPIATMIAYGVYDLALGSRILGGGALRGGMPRYKYVANRLLTLFQNLMMGAKLSEYHTGFRAFSRELLEALPLERNSDDFVFDNQLLAQAALVGARIGEISCPTRYFKEASSINFRRSSIYGLGELKTSLLFRFAKWGIYRSPIFNFHPNQIGRREEAPVVFDHSQ
jgi:glycosyltransferase involved in cell wall biosynthesis